RIMADVLFATGTTGLDPNGDRIVEVGAIELVNHFPTGRTFHPYLNPERSMSLDAARIHGLDDTFLRDKPAFAAIADDLVAFFADANLIAHNASFDIAFLNAELGRLQRPTFTDERVIDTLILARRKFPGSPA